MSRFAAILKIRFAFFALVIWLCSFFAASIAVADIQVTVSGPGGSASSALPDAGGGFDMNLPLKKNSINKLTITAKDANGHSAQQDINVTQLSFESLAVASLKAEPLPPARIQELVNSGVIKLDDPANFNVSVFTIVLTIGNRPVPIQVPIAIPKVEEPTGSEETPPLSDPGNGSSNPSVPDVPPEIVVFEVRPSIPGVEAPSIPGVLVIEGRIKTLKEFFSAKFLLMNTSGIFTLSDVTAKLEFPDEGLSSTLPADGVAALGDILPGVGDIPGQALKEFIFRGDEKGIRKIRVSFGGKVTGAGIPEGEEVPFNGAAETSVEVKGPPSFAVKLSHPDYVNTGVPYEFGVEITNTGDTPALYTSLDLDVGFDGSIIDCKIENGDPVCVDTEEPVTRNFGNIYPGQTVKETFLINPKVTGPITSCMGISDQNIDLSVTVGNIGCITGKVSPPSGVPSGVPTVNVLPFSNALGISPESPVVFLFSEKMNRSTLTTGAGGNLNVFDRGGNIVPGQLRFDLLNGRDVVVWQVNDGILNRFVENSEYSIEVKNTVKDLQGTQLFSNWGSKFTTSGEGLNDFTPPTISLAIEAPVDANNVLPGQLVRVNAFVADQGSAVQKVELRADDLSIPGVEFKLLDQKNVLTGDKPPFFFLMDSKNLIPGHTYQLRGTAYDFAGNTQDAILSIIVAATAPIPTVQFSPDTIEVLKGVPVQITPGQVTGGAFEVNYLLDGAPFKVVNVIPYSVSIPTVNLTVGEHTLQAIARDGLDQTGGSSKQFTVLANSNAPQISFDTPANNQLVIPDSSLSVKATIQDPVGLQSIQWFFDDPNGAPFATGVSQFVINTVGIPLGTYKLYVKATNNLGLANDVNAPGSSRTIQIANPPPAPPPGAPSVNSTPPSGGFTTVSGVTEPNRKVDIKNVTKNITVTVFSDGAGNYSGQINADAGDDIQVFAYDPQGQNAGAPASNAVNPPSPVTSLAVTPPSLNFTQFNATADLNVIATRADNSTEDVTSQASYGSTNGSVASVNSSGKVVSLGNGTTVLTVNFGGKTETVNVSVSVRVLQSLTVTPNPISFGGVGQTSQLDVTGNFSDNTTESLTATASYATGNPNVALVSGSGLVTAIGNGSTQISVSRPGLAPTSVPVTVTLADSVNPAVTIDSPTAGSQFERGQVIPVQVTGTDGQSGVRRITLTASGAFTFNETRDVTIAPSATQTFNVFVPAGVALPGTVTFAAKVEDAAGNFSSLANRSFAIVDLTGPTVSVLAPAPATPYNSGDTITLQVSASDSVGVTQVRYVTEGSFAGSGSQSFPGTAGTQNATFNINVPFGVTIPDLTLRVFAKDAAGNETAATPFNVNITSADITAPITQATSVSAPSGTNVTVSYVVNDGLPDLDHVELYFRRNNIGTFNRYTNASGGNAQGKFNPQSGNTGTIVFDSTKMGGDGAYEFYTVGVDAAGNREAAPMSGGNVLPDQTSSISAGTVVTTVSINTSITNGDVSFDNKNLLVTGPITLTVDGSHTFKNIDLKNGAKLVHSDTTASTEFSLDLTAWTISIDATSSINTTGRGYLGGNQPGNAGVVARTNGNVAGATSGSGGSYGGPGGVFDGATNATYGSLVAPAESGSGGGGRGGAPGGDGGGKVHISAVNIAADGNIVADGAVGAGNVAGSGSGGSLNLAVSTLSGTGLLTANGGGNQAGGSGGRIAVTYVDLSTKNQSLIRALGGLGNFASGGNGTVFLKELSQTNGNLIFDGQSGVNSFTTLPIPNGFTFDNIIIRNNARVLIDQPLNVNNAFKVESNSTVSHSTTSTAGLKIAAKSISVDNTSSIDVVGRGYLGGCAGGNGNEGDTLGGLAGATSGSGGSYGGSGGRFDGTLSSIYGSSNAPVYLGSGGGCRGGAAGGNGGGLINLTATDFVDVEGSIKADGAVGAGNVAGSGSGGSIKIQTSILKGQGLISSNGGDNQAGGGGGRVYVTYNFIPAAPDNLNGLLNIKARGGRGNFVNASPGTVLLKRADQQLGDLYIDDERAANSAFETELTPVGFQKIIALATDTITTDGSYQYLPGSLVGLEFLPNISQSTIYKIIANTADTITVDLTAKPSLSSVTAVNDICSAVYRFDNVTTRRGGTLTLADKLVVADTLHIQDFGRLTHRNAMVTPGTFLFTYPRLNVLAQNIIIEANSSVNVVGRGYPGGLSADDSGLSDRGLTQNFALGAVQDAGGSFGGLGGRWSGQPTNSVYGSVTDPNDFGSGGGARGGAPGGDGGGWIALQASSIVVDGIIDASGNVGSGNVAGSGSGGTVNLKTTTLTGSGIIRANGGANQAGGGGGRISVNYGSSLGYLPSQFEVDGGQGNFSIGGNGTLFLRSQSQSDGDLIIEGIGANTPFDEAVYPVGQAFDNLTITNNARLITSAPLNAKNIQITNGSLVTHPIGYESGLTITGQTLLIDGTSSIDVSGRGYRGALRDGNVNAFAETLGLQSGATGSAGGSYGGTGIPWEASAASNLLYGSPLQAEYLGSGGGSRGGTAGGNGGGRVTIEVQDSVTIDGSVLANGQIGAGNVAGSGSGGSIQIQSDSIAGSGTIAANGGGNQAAGGGGRVVLEYGTLAATDFSNLRNIQAFGGRGNFSNASAGTVLIKNVGQQLGDLYIDDNTVGSTAPVETTLTPIGFGIVSAVDVDTLTLDGGVAVMPGALAGLQINPNIAQNQTFTIISNTATTIDVDTSNGNLNSVSAVGNTYALMYNFDNVIFRRGGYLSVADKLEVSGNLTIAENGRLTHPRVNNLIFTPHLDVFAGALQLSSNSLIEVDGRGYLGGCQPNNGNAAGRTLNFALGSVSSGGGSYGGLGGLWNVDGSINAVYGLANNPLPLGSGGGCRGGTPGGNGGGSIRIIAGAATIDGIVTANGNIGAGNVSGSGSGGSVNMNFGSLTGSGTIRANGGGNQSGGGGGRVYVNSPTNSFTSGQYSATGGPGNFASGANGTVVVQ